MSKLSPHEVVTNCRTAFDAAEKLGIPRVIEPRDMSLLAVPDKLAVMTYLYQLRSHFTGFQLQIEQLGNTSDESSYIIGNYKTDTLPGHNIMKLDHLKIHLQNQQQHSCIAMLNEDGSIANDGSGQKPSVDKKDVKNKIFSGSKHLLGKVLSPAKDRNSIAGGQQAINNQTAAQPPMLMTRRELTDPFGSDDEDEQKVIHEEQKETTPTAPNLDPTTTNVSISPTLLHFFFINITISASTKVFYLFFFNHLNNQMCFFCFFFFVEIAFSAQRNER